MQGYKILDNGAAEGDLVAAEELITLAAEIGANEIIVPDVLGDELETIWKAREFKAIAEAHPEFKYIGVIQGTNYKTLSQCLMFMESMKYMSIYALPRIMCKDDQYARATFAAGHYKSHPSVKYHCLGSSYWCEETKVLANLPMVRSMDTAMPIKMGIRGQRIESDSSYNVETHDLSYFEWQSKHGLILKEFQGGAIDGNIRTFLEWAQAPSVS